MASPTVRESASSAQVAPEMADLGLALDQSQAVIEFDPHGKILRANDLFLGLMGFEPEEIAGRHHRMFCREDLAASPEYEAFWADLRAGRAQEGEFRRIAKDGREVWIRAKYYPVRSNGAVRKIIKLAMDISATKLESIVNQGMLAAIGRAQAVIEFDLDGTILNANPNFLSLTGYTLPEVVGQHHSMFCAPETAGSTAYKEFWEKLARGEFHAGEYKRRGRGARELWIQATYNPILDIAGKPIKIVKYAMDVTDQKMSAAEAQGKVDAISRSHAVIEFDPDGNILNANAAFCSKLGYAQDEIVGQHHRMFCDPEHAASEEYRQFWRKLARGEHESGEFRRLTRDGESIWIQASYSPILDLDGKVFKVIKYALDVTDQKRLSSDHEGKVNAIGRAQAMVEFDLEGRLLDANANFLQLMGYPLEDVVGKHHRMFCEEELVQSSQYEEFWQRLSRGDFFSGEFKRIGNGGREVWIQATYNPILGLTGKPVKIVKFAMDVTELKMRNAEYQSRVAAVDRSQATIEFDLSGEILTANENFLSTMGYSLREIVGQHHSIFCDPEYLKTKDYGDFWLRLNKGETQSGRFHRLGKFGRDVYIQASYSPVYDLAGRPVRVIKYAYDVTQQVQLEQHIASKTNDMRALVAQLTDAITTISGGVDGASQVAEETEGAATRGSEALNNAMESIELIHRSSQQISKIVGVIGELANQTNLLAFNAAIEAARAGEHGIGFSVVAEEVRKLAERSAEAAEEIGRLIEESAERVEHGTTRSRSAHEAFTRIVESVGKTARSIDQIAQSTSVQRDLSNSVVRCIEDLTASTASKAA